MLYAILYALGALCFWMWEYEDGEVGWRRWVTPIVWPVFVLVRIVELITYSLGNVLIERRLKAEEKLFWEEKESESFAEELVRKQIEWRDAAVDPNLVIGTTSESYDEDLAGLRERALGPTWDYEEDDDGMITLDDDGPGFDSP